MARSRKQPRRHLPISIYPPCIFPAGQRFPPRDEFATDCKLRHLVLGCRDFALKPAGNPRIFRAFAGFWQRGPSVSGPERANSRPKWRCGSRFSLLPIWAVRIHRGFRLARRLGGKQVSQLATPYRLASTSSPGLRSIAQINAVATLADRKSKLVSAVSGAFIAGVTIAPFIGGSLVDAGGYTWLGAAEIIFTRLIAIVVLAGIPRHIEDPD